MLLHNKGWFGRFLAKKGGKPRGEKSLKIFLEGAGDCHPLRWRNRDTEQALGCRRTPQARRSHGPSGLASA